jgi:hypothetical protein
VLVLIFIALAVGLIGSVPLAIVGTRTGLRIRGKLLALAGPDSLPVLYVRRHAQGAGLFVSLVIAWIAPLLLIRDGASNWLAVGVSAVGFVLSGRLYWLMSRTYARELALMPLDKRIEALNTRLKEVRTAWFSVAFVVAVQILSFGLNNGFAGRLPPEEADHWMQLLQLTISVLLVVNQVISLVVYRRWKRDALALKEVAP